MDENQITVNKAALKSVLEALIGPAHYIRELQATRNLPALGDGYVNPINQLIADFERQ